MVLSTQPKKPGSKWLHVHVYVLQKGFPVLCDYLINCLLLYVSFVSSNIQVGFQYLALFFREQIRQIGKFIFKFKEHLQRHRKGISLTILGRYESRWVSFWFKIEHVGILKTLYTFLFLNLFFHECTFGEFL